MGRKKKFLDGTVQLGLVVPPLYADMIKESASGQGVSVNEYLNNIIACHDKELVDKITNELILLRGQLKKTEHQVSLVTVELNKYKEKSKNVSSFVTEIVNEDANISEALVLAERRFGDKYRRIALNAGENTAEVVIRDAYLFVENKLAEKNCFVKKSVMLRAQLRKKLIEVRE